MISFNILFSLRLLHQNSIKYYRCFAYSGHSFYLNKQKCERFQKYCVSSEGKDFLPKDLNSDQNNSKSKIYLKGILNEVDDYVDNLFSHIFTSITEKKRVYKNDVMNAIKYMYEKKYISNRDGILLVQCCSKLLIDVKPDERMELLNQVWNLLKIRCDITVEHYNALLRSYIDNNKVILTHEFLDEMFPLKPTEDTYYWLLCNVCKHGNINQASEIMSNMKNDNMQFTERFFNKLIEGYGKACDINSSLKFIDVMKNLNITPSSATETSLINGYILSGDLSGAKNRMLLAKENSVKFSDSQIIDIIRCLIQINNLVLVPECFSLISKEILSSLSMSHHLHTFCFELIHNRYIETAYFIYRQLPINNNENSSTYAKMIIRESLKVSNSITDFLFIIDDLIKSGRNTFSFYIAFEAAIHFSKYDIACQLLEKMKENNILIRCHFYWPLLVAYSKHNGEKGVFQILSLMNNLNVIPDHETMLDYIIPHISIVSPQDLLKKFQSHGLPLSVCLTPIVQTLLKQGDAIIASDLCEMTVAHLDCDELMFPLLLSYLTKEDLTSTHNILKMFQEKTLRKDKDSVGKFLLIFFTYRKWSTDIKLIEKLIKALDESNTKISPRAVEGCIFYLNGFECNEFTSNSIIKRLTNMSDPNYSYDDSFLGGATPNQQSLSLKELNKHLIELETKNMNTRGVLRKLLQQYCQKNDFDEALLILRKCQDRKVVLSAGMNSSVMNIYVHKNDLKNAKKYFMDLKKHHSDFILDEFKIVDYATLLINNGLSEEARDVLTERASHGHLRCGKNIETNCWNLLNAIAAQGKAMETQSFFSLLIKLGYCEASNILLGPLIRVYLNNQDIVGAVAAFSDYGKKYRKTPLKHELLCALVNGSYNIEGVKKSVGSHSLTKKDYQNLLTKVQAMGQSIHGSANFQISLIAALAETGLSKPLRKYLLSSEIEINYKDFFAQCERFSKEGKIEALNTIAQCTCDLKNFKVEMVYELILKAQYYNNDTEGILNTWSNIEKQNIRLNESVLQLCASLLQSDKKTLPFSLINQLNENERSMLFE